MVVQRFYNWTYSGAVDVTLKLETIVREMGKKWVEATRHQARQHFHYCGCLELREWETRYIKIEYNLQKRKVTRTVIGRIG